MHWSPQQDAALRAVSDWLNDKHGPQVFRLFGYAGTGKSTLATYLAGNVHPVCFAAFTGKAALVMKKRGCHGARTIHSLIYRMEDEVAGQAKFVLNQDSEAKYAKLIVIDECSMVGEELARDLLSFGRKVLVLGDPFQLPPVKDAGFFTNAKPDIMLTEIHRQARDNPIIRMSMDIRERRGLHYGTYGESKVIHRDEVEQEEVLAADQIIVGVNKTRHAFNSRVRQLREIEGPHPTVGEKVICLRNNHAKKLLNGQMWKVGEFRDKGRDEFELVVLPEDEPVASRLVYTHASFFTGEEDQLEWKIRRQYDEFTFGYAITCHKAQGSQWNNVYLFDESGAFRDDRDRWLYTAVTRASERITVVA